MDFWFEEIFPMCISCPQLGGGRELTDKAGHEEIKWTKLWKVISQILIIVSAQQIIAISYNCIYILPLDPWC